MFREIIKPTNEYYSLHIPKEYLNKDIEIIVLPLFDLKESKEKSTPKIFNPKEFYGLASSSKEALDKYLTASKNEWE